MATPIYSGPTYADAYAYATAHGYAVDFIQKVTFWDGRQVYTVLDVRP